MFTFAERLINEIREQNITQKDLADKTEITTATISRYISGQRHPSAENVARIAKVLNVSVDYLLGSTPDKGTSKKKQSDKEKLDDFLQSARLHFMDAKEEDQDKIMRCLQDIFWETKEINRQKYNPNKNRKLEN